MKNTNSVCSYCGAPVEVDADRCSYCRISYKKPIRTIDATNFLFDVKLRDETIQMYIADIQDCCIVDTARDAQGRFTGSVVRPRCRKITLVEV